MDFYDLEAVNINGEQISMSRYEGKVVLIVNTACKSSLSSQIEELEVLYKVFRDRGFDVLAFPCNQFKGDKETVDKINEVCINNYGTTFEIFEKICVNGEDTHDVYKFLKQSKQGVFGDSIKWNFTKFLLDRDGKVVKRYSPMTSPMNIKKDIEKLM